MKRKLSIVGIIIGISLIIIGITSVILGADGICQIGSWGSFGHEDGYATFGSDFYTYTNNNSARTAENSEIIADNLNDIGEMLFIFIGLITICFGFIVICSFGIILSGCPKKEKSQEPITEEAQQVPTQDNAEGALQSSSEESFDSN